MRSIPSWLALPVVALGYSLRVDGLAVNSLWLDEGFTWSLSHAPGPYILRQTFTREPNPPLYFLALHGWAQVTGWSEFSLRYLSLAAGVLLLPLLLVLGLRLFGRWVALASALLASANPFLVWYSQEARMYALVALLAALSTYLFIRALARPSRARWVWFVVVTVLGLYTHLFAILVLAAQAAFLGWLWLGRRWSSRRGTASLVVSLLLYSPWLLAIPGLPQGTLIWRPLLGLPQIVGLSLQNFATFAHLPGLLDGLTWVGLAVLALVGMAGAVRGGREARKSGSVTANSAGVLLLSWFVVPMLLVYALSFKEPLYAPRYLIVAAPPLYLAIAAGLAAVRMSGRAGRRIAQCLLALAVALEGVGTWRGQLFPKENYRAAAEFVDLRAQAGDAVLFEPPYLEYPFEYYYEFRDRGPAELLPLEASAGDPGLVERSLAELAPRFGTLWLVNGGHTGLVDPRESALAWLSARYPRSADVYLPGVHLVQYTIRYLADSLPPGATPTDISFADLQLKGLQLRPAPRRTGAWNVALFWQASGPPVADYHISLQVFDRQGRKAGQVDGEPLGAGLPTSRFPLRKIVLDSYLLRLPPGTPPGLYELRISLYPGGGANVPATSPLWKGERFQVALAELALTAPAA